ncbi:MAG: A1 family peptidase [bacterium]|nr:A1 family peptidase [bacterium]
MNTEPNTFPDAWAAGTKKIVFPLRRGTVNDNGATPWFTTLPMGTPTRGDGVPQAMKFALDTGTTFTWVTSTRCTTSACLMHGRFSFNDSGSYRQIGNPRTPVSISFGAWGKMDAFLGRDFLTLNRAFPPENISPVNQLISFYLSTSYEGSQFEDLLWDGAIALPSKKKSGPDSDQLLFLLKESGMLDVALVSFWSNAFTGKGVCLMGAVDYSKFDPSTLNTIPVHRLPAPNDSLWSIKMEELVCDDAKVLEDINFVLDTGSSRFKGDKRYIERIKSAITKNWELPDVLYGADPDFDEYPDLELKLNGQTYRLRPWQYFMEVSPGVWEAAFEPLDGLDGILLVGSVFLDTVYGIFNAESETIALATPLF